MTGDLQLLDNLYRVAPNTAPANSTPQVVLFTPPISHAPAAAAPTIIPRRNLNAGRRASKRLYPYQPARQFVPAPVGRNVPCPCGSGKKAKHCCRS